MTSLSPRHRKILLIQALYGLADEELQRRAWFGAGPEVSSPDEAVNQFYDADVEGHLISSELGRSPTDLLTQLARAMDDFCAATPDHLKPEAVLNDARWVEIRRLAGKLISVLEASETLPKEPLNV